MPHYRGILLTCFCYHDMIPLLAYGVTVSLAREWEMARQRDKQLHVAIASATQERIKREAEERDMSVPMYVEEVLLTPSAPEVVAEFLRDGVPPALTRYVLERCLRHCDEVLAGDSAEGGQSTAEALEWRQFKFEPLVAQLRERPKAVEGDAAAGFLEEQARWLIENLPAGVLSAIRNDMGTLGIFAEKP